MRASYELRVDDLHALMELQNSRTKNSKLLLMGTLLLYVSTIAYALTKLPLNVLPALLIPMVVFAITLVRAIRHTAPGRAMVKSTFCGPCELKIEKDGLTEIRSSGEVKRNWSAIDRLVQTKTHLFIYTAGWIAFVLPRRAFFDDDSFSRFVRTIEDRSTVPVTLA